MLLLLWGRSLCLVCRICLLFFFFFFNDTATTEIYTLSLHDALPIQSSSSTNASPHGAPHLRRGDRSEQAVRFVVRARREEQRVRRAGVEAVAEADAPQPVDLDRRVVGALHNAVLLPAVLALAERVDPAVPEVADQQ